MRVLLMVPPLVEPIPADLSDVFEDVYGDYPPIGVLSLAASVRAGTRHEVAVLDPVAERLDRAATLDRVKSLAPDLVGITALSFHMPDVIALVRGIRDRLDRCRIVLGGPHAHIYPSSTAALDGVEAVFTGEGEESLPAYLDALEAREDPSLLPGVVTMRDGRAVGRGPARPIPDLDRLPLPARDLVDVRLYRAITGLGGPLTTVMSSRGCPYACTFCDRPQLGKAYRWRTAPAVLAELEACVSLGIREVIFFDDTFTIHRPRTLELAAALARRRLPLIFDARTRVDLVDGALLAALRAAGLRRLSFGVEAGTQAVLDTLRKGTTVDQVRCAVAACRAEGIEVHLDFMIGSPGETPDQVERTITLALDLSPEYVQFTATTPYPATDLYRQALARGIVTRDVWAEFARDPRAGFQPPLWEEHLSRREIVGLVERAYRRFYLRPRFIARKLLSRGFWYNARRYVGAAARIASGTYVRRRGGIAGEDLAA